MVSLRNLLSFVACRMASPTRVCVVAALASGSGLAADEQKETDGFPP